MKNIAIIPARGGSKRIPHKNIRPFSGKPIIAYSIEVAMKSGLFREVMVSTDSEEIADISKQYGASVPFFRSKKTSDDYATIADVIDEVKKEYLSIGKSFDLICCILPTAPLITIENLTKGYELLLKENADSVRPIVQFSYPIQRALKTCENKIEMFHPEHVNTRSQDLEKAFHDAGQFYWMKSESGLRGANKFGFEISEIQVQDIDNEVDWELAEMKYQIMKNHFSPF